MDWKQIWTKTPSYHFEYGVCVLPHEQKVERGGEDAFVTTSTTLGVFDGVSAWFEKLKIDAGAYSWSIAQSFNKAKKNESISNSLDSAYKNTQILGSCTVCVVKLMNQQLQTANIGDSGFLLIRNNGIACKSTPTRHEPDRPFQLGLQNDGPQVAVLETFEVQVNDLVILASDGVWDNLTEEDVLNMAQTFATYEPLCVMPNKLAWAIGTRASRGKVKDDITVVVGRVCLS
jgi:protein phosphatase PTC7